MSTTNNINKLYSPAYIQYLFQFLLPMYPCWSSIILQRLNIRRDSDAVVEDNWGLLKNNICKDKPKQSPQVYVQNIEPYIKADINRRTISIKGVNRCREKITNIDSTTFAQETWVRGNHHFEGPKNLRVSIGCQTDGDTSILLDEAEYSTRLICAEDDFQEIDVIEEHEDYDTIETDCEGTRTESFVIDSELNDNLNNPPNTTSHQKQCINICDISDVNIFNDYTDYPEGFPGRCKASIYGIIIDSNSWTTLQANACLNDNIMNGFLMVMSDVAKSSLGLKVVPLESFFTESLLSKAGLSVGYRSELASSAIWECNVCLLPNQYEAHTLGSSGCNPEIKNFPLPRFSLS